MSLPRDVQAELTAPARVGAPELRLLVRLLRGDTARTERYLAGAREPLDLLADACAQSGLSVVLLRTLEDSPLRARVSPERLAVLEQRRRRQEERQGALGQALLRIADCFRAAGQRFLLLKGPYLASRFYGRLLGREFLDLDLLVPRSQRQRAAELLAGAGYRLRSRTWLGNALTSRFVHGFDFAGAEASVDLHWALSCHPSLHLDEQRWWARCSSWVVDGRPYEVLGDEDEVIFAALSLLRDVERGRPKAKNIVDLIQILAATDDHLDWQAMLAPGHGTRGPLVNVLSTCLDLAEAHDLAPRLAAALENHRSRRTPASATEAPLRFRPSRLALGNKLWAARAYDTSLPAWFAWWALSLPFRLLVHRRPRRAARAYGPDRPPGP